MFFFLVCHNPLGKALTKAIQHSLDNKMHELVVIDVLPTQTPKEIISVQGKKSIPLNKKPKLSDGEIKSYARKMTTFKGYDRCILSRNAFSYFSGVWVIPMWGRHASQKIQISFLKNVRIFSQLENKDQHR